MWSSTFRFFLFLFSLSCCGQDLVEIGQQLSLRSQQNILSQSLIISSGETYDRLHAVFNRMTTAAGFAGGARIPYRLLFTNSPEINAYAVGGGLLYITSGLVRAVQGNDGILAFVMGHEMVHNRNQHLEQKYLRLVNINFQYRQLLANNGQLAATLFETAARIAEAKAERDEEHEADQLGLLIAAQAGYHPDYAIFATRTLRAEAGEQSKFGAFFSSHPRWTTREERTARNYDLAINAFDAVWPSAELSPGGRPPAIATLSPVAVRHSRRTVLASTSVRVRNLRQPARLQFLLIGEHDPQPLALASDSYIADQPLLTPTTITISPEVLSGRKGKQYVMAQVSSGTAVLCQTPLARIR